MAYSTILDLIGNPVHFYLAILTHKVELNKWHDFNKITEAGAQLKPLWGPGYTGIKNLGNSCYMNSCLKVLPFLACTRRYDTKRYDTIPDD